ncbi:MAG TPA: hypothetical protein DDY38_10270 [Firmicutes bacterium]|nr:hypothetical protein [Bacillota bacterium]
MESESGSRSGSCSGFGAGYGSGSGSASGSGSDSGSDSGSGSGSVAPKFRISQPKASRLGTKLFKFPVPKVKETGIAR